MRKHVPLFLSIGVQLILAFFLGHVYDIRVFMATGYLVGTGQSPYIAQNLSAVFHNSAFQSVASVGDFPPWPLILGLVYLISYKLIPNLLLYNLAIKIPIVTANIGLAYLTANILSKLGAAEKVAHQAWIFLLFNPFLLYATSAWGQFDSLVALLSLLALLRLSEEKLTSSAILLALAFIFKPTVLPLILVVFIYLRGRPFRLMFQYFSILFVFSFVLLVGPFVIFRWDTTPILQHWNFHFSVADGLSYATFLELIKGSDQIPSLGWLAGLLWAPALVIAMFALKPDGEGLLDLLKNSAALILVFFLFQVRVTEPNTILILPLVLILASMGALDPRVLTAVWILPMIFGFFNTSMFQLLFPSMPILMDRLLQLSDVFRTARLVLRIIVVIPWLYTGGWIVLSCLKGNRIAGDFEKRKDTLSIWK